MLGGHSCLEGLKMWKEPAPLAGPQKMPSPTCATSVGFYGSSLVFLLLCSLCCPQMPAGDSGPCRGLGLLWLLGSFLWLLWGFEIQGLWDHAGSPHT